PVPLPARPDASPPPPRRAAPSRSRARPAAGLPVRARRHVAGGVGRAGGGGRERAAGASLVPVREPERLERAARRRPPRRAADGAEAGESGAVAAGPRALRLSRRTPRGAALGLPAARRRRLPHRAGGDGGARLLPRSRAGVLGYPGGGPGGRLHPTRGR